MGVEIPLQTKVCKSFLSTRMIKKAYDSSFYRNPIETIKIMKEKVSGLEGKTKQIYENVYNRYKRVMELHKELN